MSGNKAKKGDGTKLIASNRRARHDFMLGESYEGGLALRGTEVKSLRTATPQLQDAYIKIDGGEAWLVKCYIPEYELGTANNHEPTRRRKVLLHKREIDRIEKETRERGVTLVPTRLYFKGGRAKVAFAVARPKTKGDKRDTERKRQADRDVARALKERNR